jgi:hypothetical protein
MYIDYNRRDLDSLKTYHISPDETRVTYPEKMKRNAIFYNVDRVLDIVQNGVKMVETECCSIPIVQNGVKMVEIKCRSIPTVQNGVKK